MSHVTLISDSRRLRLPDELRRRGCVVEEVHYTAFLGNLKLATGAVSDVVICFPLSYDYFREGYLTYPRAKALRDQMFSLPHDVCMADGRKWRAIPFLMLFDENDLSGSLYDLRATSKDLYSYYDENDAFRRINSAVDEYKGKVLGGFDNLGFLVKYENGRFRLGPALGGKKNLENDFYNGKADQTRGNKSALVTVNREIYGIQYEVEQLEFLINKKDIREAELQKFFEENPHFLASHRQGIPLPHPRFAISENNTLIPDFLMKPSIGRQRDSNWEVLDLKLPNAKLLTGKGNRTRFTQEVANALTQLKDYSDFFRNPSNEAVIREVLAHHLRYPKLAVLIGRMPKDGEIEALELAQSREPQVKLITYDEILDSQRNLLN